MLRRKLAESVRVSATPVFAAKRRAEAVRRPPAGIASHAPPHYADEAQKESTNPLMRRIGTLTDRKQADRFGDFLLTKQIAAQIDSAGDEWAIWVHEEDRLEEARNELQSFRADPDAERYQNAVVEADRIRHAEVRKRQQARRKTVNMTDRWRRPLIQQIPLTFALVVVSVVVSLGTQFGKSMDSFGGRLSIIEVRSDGADSWIAVDSATGGPRRGIGLTEIRRGQIWRLVTPIFLHLGIFHLLFNMYWTVVFGSLIETHKGLWMLLAIVIVTAVISNLSQYYFKSFGFGGMSGVGYGMFGFLWMLGRTNPRSAIHIPPNILFLFLAWLLICMTGAIGPIANYAHAFGLFSGMSIGAARGFWEKTTGKT
jgi:GlpG protein